MARRRRRKQGNQGATLVVFAFLGLAYVVGSHYWLGLLGLLVVAGLVVAGLVAGSREKRQQALALRDLQALTPRELELHVARVVGALPGWRAEATRGSADQGADVIAVSPSGARVAIQVKHYRSAVGNKAVQEIVASRAYYRCTHAVVVTSGPGYTRAAQELARVNAVPLWGPADLFRLQELAAQAKGPPALLLPA